MWRTILFRVSHVPTTSAASSKKKRAVTAAKEVKAAAAPNEAAKRAAGPSSSLKAVAVASKLRVPPAVSELQLDNPTISRFSELVTCFKTVTEYLSDIEDPMETPEGAKTSSADSVRPSENPLHPLIFSGRTFAAAITCPKKFFLMQYRPDLLPREAIGETVRYDDAATFSELARRWDRLQFGSKATLIDASDFDEAQRQTEKVILEYFAANASLAEQAPTLTLHRPAFAGPCPVPSQTSRSERPLLLRARPLVVRYRPKDNQWVILLSQANVDPVGTSAKASQCLQRIHFAMRAFRNWVTQPHIPITLRKRFLTVNMDPEGHAGDDTPSVAPIDVKRSGVLHIRQHFPGPVSVLDCDPQKIVKYIQRLSLEELLQQECTAVGEGGGVFAMSQLAGPVHPVILKRYQEMRASASTAFPGGKVRSSRSLKKRDTSEKDFFEHQQELMSSILTHYVPDLVQRCEDIQQRERWTAFSDDTNSEKNPPPKMPTGKGKTASKPLPCYSEHLGGHCMKGGERCPFFVEGKCLPQKVENPLKSKDNHLFTLPSSAVTKKVAWWTEGYRTVKDVASAKKTSNASPNLSAAQLRYAQAVTTGTIALNPGVIDQFFSSIHYPLFILDFEATAYAVPPHRKVVAYQSVPFQFSLDVFQKDVLTETPTHYDFLHFGKGYSPNQDPRRMCINELMRIVNVEREKKRLELLDAPLPVEPLLEEPVQRGRGRPAKVKPKIPTAGPLTPYDGCFLAHFAAFERSCLEKLGLLEEMYKEAIKGFYFLDTLELFKKGVVHPNAHGSNSLKKVLPAICPDFQYGVFGVEEPSTEATASTHDEQQGANALALYRIWHHHEGGDSIRQLLSRSASALNLPPTIDAKEREKVWTILRIQLLEYCSMDTRAIYELMREIWRMKEQVEKQPDLTLDKGGWVYVNYLKTE